MILLPVVSIAQSRKALLPPKSMESVTRAVDACFNRSVAKSPSATRGAKDERLCEVARFQSLSREKPFCHSKRSRSIKREREFQSLSREKPFCHETTTTVHTMPGQHVSIAQSRKALLPPAHWQPSRLLDKACFNRSVAKSPSATPYGGHKMATQTKMFQSLSREKPFCHLEQQLYCDDKMGSFNRSVAKSPSATRRDQHRQNESLVFQSLSREKPFCHAQDQGAGGRTRLRFNRSVAKSPSATTRALFPRRTWNSFNRSVAKSPSATARLRRYAQPAQCFNRSVAKSPSATYD